jgi:hypothetical protein
LNAQAATNARRLDADDRKGLRARVWSSKHNPGTTTKHTGFSLLVIFAAIQHFWHKKQTHETLTGILCRSKVIVIQFALSHCLELLISTLIVFFLVRDS